MRLYLDDNITDRRVVAQLHRMGHVVLLPVTVGHSGVSDAKHLAYAIREREITAAASSSRTARCRCTILIRMTKVSWMGRILFLRDEPENPYTDNEGFLDVARSDYAAGEWLSHPLKPDNDDNASPIFKM